MYIMSNVQLYEYFGQSVQRIRSKVYNRNWG